MAAFLEKTERRFKLIFIHLTLFGRGLLHIIQKEPVEYMQSKLLTFIRKILEKVLMVDFISNKISIRFLSMPSTFLRLFVLRGACVRFSAISTCFVIFHLYGATLTHVIFHAGRNI